jgi:PAS domain-containing protein
MRTKTIKIFTTSFIIIAIASALIFTSSLNSIDEQELRNIEQLSVNIQKTQIQKDLVQQLINDEKYLQLKNYSLPTEILNGLNSVGGNQKTAEIKVITTNINRIYESIGPEDLVGKNKLTLKAISAEKFNELIALQNTLLGEISNQTTKAVRASRTLNLILYFTYTLLAIVSFSGIIWLFSNQLKLVQQKLHSLIKGNYQANNKYKLWGKEFYLVDTLLNKVSAQYEIIAKYVESLSKNEDNKTLEALIESDEDLASNEILKALKETKDALQKSKVENEQRTWASEGLATFTEILRKNSNNLKDLCDQVLVETINYLKLNQGGVFLINELETEDESQDIKTKVLEQISCYAYGRSKFSEKVVPIGSGLLGQCVLEQAPVYLTDLPENYTFITSGIGEATPKSLYIAPLIANDEVLGVIELASLKELQAHEREFIDKISEVIAGTVATVKVNEMTKNLLAISQQKSEALQSQEEEMRQNLEELEATQEESSRKSMELSKRISTIDESGILSAEFTPKGQITQYNQSLNKLFGLNQNEGKNTTDLNFFELVSAINDSSFDFEALLHELEENGIFKGEFQIKINEQTYYLKGAISIIEDVRQNKKRLLFFGSDITENKLLLEAAKQKTEEVERIRKEEKERSDFEINSVNDMMNIYMENNRKDNDKLRARIKELEQALENYSEHKQERA